MVSRSPQGGKRTFTSSSVKGRLLTEVKEVFDGALQTAFHNGRVAFLEPDANVTINDQLTFGGRDYEIESVEECFDKYNERHQWQLVIR